MTDSAPKPNQPISRRDVLRQGFRSISKGIGFVVGSKLSSMRRTCIRPPGAITEGAFVITCQRCHACVEACSENAILVHPGPEIQTLGTPYLKPAEKACWWCQDMPCIAACSSGALALEPDKRPAPIARTLFNAEVCMEARGQPCDSCAKACPPGVNALTKVSRKPPTIDDDACVGCGYCAAYCPSHPAAIQIGLIEAE